MKQEVMAVASAGPYANHFQTGNHANCSSLNYLQARCSSWRQPTVYKHWRLTEEII